MHTAPPRERADHLSQTHGPSPSYTPIEGHSSPCLEKQDQGHLLLIFTPSCCRTSPSKALPEFLLWPLYQFLLIKKSPRTRVGNKLTPATATLKTQSQPNKNSNWIMRVRTSSERWTEEERASPSHTWEWESVESGVGINPLCYLSTKLAELKCLVGSMERGLHFRLGHKKGTWEGDIKARRVLSRIPPDNGRSQFPTIGWQVFESNCV